METEDKISWLSALSLPVQFFRFGRGSLSGLKSQLGLSARFMAIADTAYVDYDKQRRLEIKSREPNIQFESLSSRCCDVIYTIKNGAKLYLCPFSGIWQETRYSIGNESYWASFGDRSCIILQFSAALHASSDSGYFFPNEKIVLFYEDVIPEQELRHHIETLCWAVSQNTDVLSAHLGNALDRAAVAVAEMKVPHFGHYVWNGLSDWGCVIPEHSNNIAAIISWNESQFIGPINKIFNEIEDKELIYMSDEVGMIRTVSTRRFIVACCKGNYITENLANHVKKFARQICPENGLNSLQSMRQECSLIVLFGLRMSNRAWLEQEEGLLNLARSIAATTADAGFIIDGMSDGITMGWSHSFMSLSDEGKLAENLCANISEFSRCFNAVGLTMAESLVATEMCDFFIAPAGSGLAKYKWIYNKPGIVISNSIVSDKDNHLGWNIRVFEKFRDAVIPSLYIEPKLISDVEAHVRPGPEHANFHLDWKDILQSARSLIPTNSV